MDEPKMGVLEFVATLVGSYLDFVGTVVTGLAWPAAIMLAVWFFRGPLRELFPFIDRFELWGAKFELKRELTAAETTVAEAGAVEADMPVAAVLPPEAQAAPAEEPAARQASQIDASDNLYVSTPVLHALLSQMAGTDPNAAIAATWFSVLQALQRAAAAIDLKDGDFQAILLALSSRGLIPASTKRLFMDIQRIRAKLYHDTLRADPSDAHRFRNLAAIVIHDLNRAADAVEGGDPRANGPT